MREIHDAGDWLLFIDGTGKPLAFHGDARRFGSVEVADGEGGFFRAQCEADLPADIPAAVAAGRVKPEVLQW